MNLFLSRGWTLSVAESCTGGLLSAELSHISGISSVFLGGVVSYSNAAKQNILDVPSHLIKSLGAVSEPVALSMAKNVKKKFKSNWAISITGIAGPTGGSPDKPVGTVWFAVVGPAFEYAQVQVLKGDRKQIQQSAVKHALGLLLAKSE